MYFIAAKSLSASLERGLEPAKKVRKKRQVKDVAPGVATDASIEVVSLEERDDSEPQPRNQLAREILDNLNKFPHCILLTRVGQFYESYFEQAVEVATLLGIKLTTRKWDGRRIHMCGFPLMHLDKHMKTLIQHHKRFVAMCEEFPKIVSGARYFERRVVRVVTPGTLIDESFLNPYENNYLLAIHSDANLVDTNRANSSMIGLAWIDISTGDFLSKLSSLDTLRDDLVRINPREIVLDYQFQGLPSHPVRTILDEEESFVSYAHSPTAANKPHLGEERPNAGRDATASDDITEQTDNNFKAPSITYTPQEENAFNLVTSYLHANLLENMPTLNLPNREGKDGRMRIDAHTIKALEIRESMKEGGVKGSLLSTVKRTMTSSGSRLLGRWLCSPSTSLHEINARQTLVAFFHARPHLCASLRVALKDIEDAGRIVQRFLLGKGGPSDLLALGNTIKAWGNVRQLVEEERRFEIQEAPSLSSQNWASIDALMSRLSMLNHIQQRIDIAFGKEGVDADSNSEDAGDEELVEPGDAKIRPAWKFGHDKWLINPAFSEELTTLHENLKNFLHQREEKELELQRRFNAPSLTLRTSPAYGMHVHLAKKREQGELNKAEAFISIAESGTTKCYFNQEWSHLGARIVETAQALEIAERDACELLRNEVNEHAPQLRRNARIIDELDVTLGFAQLAREMNFVRPEIRDDHSYYVENGRHPTVELGLLTSGRVFTPNTTRMAPSSRLHVITGPNMAGKSTLLRQIALIAILAQTGSFVPADAATIGLVDQLFSRVGAKDDLFHGRSTFMVEMMETAEILRKATPRSLVIMDEVGRGTTVKDGLAIAFATIHHLLTINRCRALFATHFHELADMLGYTEQQENPAGTGIFTDATFFHSDVQDIGNGRFAYSYRLKPGINRDSHGLKVAQLAGLPSECLSIASATLDCLKHGEKSTRQEESMVHSAFWTTT
ncbi:DNA mismatch repair ATPase msh1 [Pleurotus pulmonarius]|nr:DNA mismatch repair ATPase msh1 [Pleurotus pulmonarius]KAF4606901.1 DNA mismatch repair ATPase msh1 [Pleurotus pulmonarius]